MVSNDTVANGLHVCESLSTHLTTNSGGFHARDSILLLVVVVVYCPAQGDTARKCLT